MLKLQRQGRGWLPDPPDSRDFTFEADAPKEVAELVGDLHELNRSDGRRPDRVDLRMHFEDQTWLVRDQGEFNTSSAFAVIGLLEYFERIAFDRELCASHAYLYCMARRIADAQGDCGATIRNCFRALRRFGVPPERYWPYNEAHLLSDPLDPFLYSFARDYAQLHYVRVSPRRASGKRTLRSVRAMLAAGFAVACGFSSPSRTGEQGEVPFRPDIHEIAEGQAVVLVGYDDTKRIGSERGALLFRNSWGPQWGADGYGWLPYAYVIERLACDFWTVIRRDWIQAGSETRRFSRPELP